MAACTGAYGALALSPAEAYAGKKPEPRKTTMSGTARASAAHSPVFEKTLPNGLKVLIQEVHTAPVVSFMVWYRVGSRNESTGITGISHLLEHMMFKGTPTYGKGEIARVLQRNGASFNAGTSLDYTCYYEVLASDRLELAMKLEADRMVNATIPEDEHRLEMTVVRSELERNEDNPHRALYLETFSQAFQAHPYHWPTIGWRTDVEQIRTDQIRRYYKAHYVPNNAIVVVVGDVEKDQALRMVERWFGGIPRGAAPPETTIVEPAQKGERRFKLRKPGDTRYLMVAWKNPAIEDPDNYPLDVLGMILGHGKTSRLHRGLVEGKLATEAEANNETAKDPFLLIASATAAPGVGLDTLESALFAEAERLKREPVTAEELARAKRQVEAAFVYAKDSIRSLANQLGYFETVASWRYVDTYLERVAQVTPEEIQRVARKYLSEDTRTVGYYEPLPPDSSDGALGGSGGNGSGAGGGAIPVLHYRDDDGSTAELAAAAAGAPSAQPATPTSAQSRPASAAAKTTRAHREVLPNGVTLVVSENHANPTVAIQGVMRAGSIFDPSGKAGLAAFVAGMLDQGTKTRTAYQQAALVESLGAHLRFEGGLETVSIGGNTLAGDLPVVLDAMADALMNPAFPETYVENVRNELITEWMIAENSTGSVAARRANEILFPEDHPYHHYALGDEGTLRSITREDLVAFHKRHYAPNGITLVLVGDVTPEEAKRLVGKSLGGWKKNPDLPAFQVSAAPKPAASKRVVIQKPGKSQTDIVCALPGIARTAPDYDAVMMMNYTLGGGSLSSRLMDSLRDRQGLVYGVYSNLTAGIGAGPIQIRAGTNPANVDQAVTAILEEVKRLHDEGPTDAEMDEAKAYLTGVFPVRLENNSGVASQLLSAEVYGLGLDYIDRYPDRIRGITTAAAKEAARRYLDLSAHALVIAGTYEGKSE
jgi:zinc protease